jgi:hypothetical protein
VYFILNTIYLSNSKFIIPRIEYNNNNNNNNNNLSLHDKKKKRKILFKGKYLVLKKKKLVREFK